MTSFDVSFLLKKIDKQKKTKWNTIKVRLTTSSMDPASTNVVSAEEHSKSFKVITEALGKNTKYVEYLNLNYYLGGRLYWVGLPGAEAQKIQG